MAIATVPRNVRRFGICIRLLYHASLVLARRTLVVKRPLFPIIVTRAALSDRCGFTIHLYRLPPGARVPSG